MSCLLGIIAIVLGLASLAVSFVLDGGHVTALFKYTAAIMVFGGTISATMLSFPIDTLKKTGKIIRVAFLSKKSDLPELIVFFRELAYKTRKSGILSIEGEIAEAKIDPFMKKGLQMVVDGIEPQAVRSILELEAEMTSERHQEGAAIFEAAGGYAPTMGIIGTVTGLVHVLGGLGNNSPDQLGVSIATAFIATLYGVGSANLLWLPLSEKLKNLDKVEASEKSLIIEAILYIQEGVNPNTITEKLKGFLNKEELLRLHELSKKVEA
ncbi:putative chemotaxis protein MotA [Clostridiales bacterium oral taxon 876 str. F0540]|nr:putative chemotaxis protein MotA [Clostridiales bacterium oral taxon 876 str. F0540]